MNRPSKLLCACWLGVLLSLSSTQVYSAQSNRNAPWNIMVVPEYDQDSLAPTHRAYRTAGAKIQDQLAHEFRFAVYDGAARNINLQCKPQCDGLARAELVKNLREENSVLATSESVQPAIDVLVFYHIMAKDVFAEIGVKRLIRVSSLAIDLSTGNTIAYDDGGQQQAKFINPAEDLTNWTLSIANRHARDSAVFMGERLHAYRASIDRQHGVELTNHHSAQHYLYLLGAIVLLLAVMVLKVSLNNRRLRRELAGFKDDRNRVNA